MSCRNPHNAAMPQECSQSVGPLSLEAQRAIGKSSAPTIVGDTCPHCEIRAGGRESHVHGIDSESRPRRRDGGNARSPEGDEDCLHRDTTQSIESGSAKETPTDLCWCVQAVRFGRSRSLHQTQQETGSSPSSRKCLIARCMFLFTIARQVEAPPDPRSRSLPKERRRTQRHCSTMSTNAAR